MITLPIVHTFQIMKEIEEVKPDVVIACSMLWDIMRYGDTFLKKEYESNLDKFFTEVKKVVPETSAIIWANSPPVADRYLQYSML